MPIDLSPEEFRRLGYRAVDLLDRALRGVGRRTVPHAGAGRGASRPHRAAGAARTAPIPTPLLDDVASTILPYPMGNSSPRFFAWVNSSAAPLAVLAELLAAGLNPSVAGGDHAATYVEHAALRWMRTIVRFPEDSGGILTSGGSVANLIGLAVMRHVKTGGRVRGAGHGRRASRRSSSTRRVKATAASRKRSSCWDIGHTNLRRIPVDAEWRMDVAALERQIGTDRAAGLTPACVAASAGTVNTGAIDPLDQIADVCRREQLWFHVDAAYGGPAALVAERGALVRRPRTRRQRRDRPAQVDVRAGRVRLRAGARRAGDARHVLARPALSSRRRRPALVF